MGNIKKKFYRFFPKNRFTNGKSEKKIFQKFSGNSNNRTIRYCFLHQYQDYLSGNLITPNHLILIY